MTYERCVGLQVLDEAAYGRYRQGMLPLLARHGGAFRYDFKVAEALLNEAGAPINRVFVLAFPDEAAHDAFFADPAYLAVREAHFKAAVSHVTVIARYTR
jgi:uncharacterized protein (DUF1330 family)